jgi:hypothetical protein
MNNEYNPLRVFKGLFFRAGFLGGFGEQIVSIY